MMSVRPSRKTQAVLVGIVGVLFSTYLVTSLLAENEWDQSFFIKFPEGQEQWIEYGEKWLGEVTPAPRLGHDGRYLFTQAMDPFYLSPDEHAYLLDRPRYRAQRMLYPMLASGFGVLGAEATGWGLLVVNVIAVGLGTWVVALVAIELGLTPWLGLGFLLNPGIIASTMIDSAEVLATAALFAAILFALREQFVWSTVWLTLAALSRETMLLGAVGLVAYLWFKKRKVPVYMAAPFLAVATWWAYLRFRIPDTGVQDTQAIGIPLKGFVEAMVVWLTEPDNLAHLLIGSLLFMIAIMIAYRAVTNPSLIAFMTAGFLLIAVLMVQSIWNLYYDSARVLSPVLTAYLLITAAAVKAVEEKNQPSVKASGPSPGA